MRIFSSFSREFITFPKTRRFSLKLGSAEKKNEAAERKPCPSIGTKEPERGRWEEHFPITGEITNVSVAYDRANG
jgi:hypothetical protein